MVALLFVSGGFASCDIDLFGTDAKEIARGYVLLVTEFSPQCALEDPGANGGPVIDEIGWRQPFIISRLKSTDSGWTVIDTATGQKRHVTAEQRLTDSSLCDIPVEQCEAAWKSLTRHKAVW